MPQYAQTSGRVYTTSASTITATNPWGQWITAGCGSATTITSSVTWNSWNSNTVTIYPNMVLGGLTETEEQRRSRLNLQSQYAKEQKAAERLRNRAKLRAKKLLVDHLNPQQREDYEKRGFFHLYTNKGRKYRIHQGTHGNVRLVDVTTDEELGRYCSQPSGVPDEDAMLAQKLYLEIDEDEFIARANFTKTKHAALLDYRGMPIERRAAA